MKIDVDVGLVKSTSAAYPKPSTFKPSYGTAGFRANASTLASTVFRCGLLAAARSYILKAHTGLMITASHNPVQDNGVKMIEADGGMLPQELEPLATELANADDDEALVRILLDKVLPSSSAESASSKSDAVFTVLVGHDTRPSAPELLEAALAGVRALGVHVTNVGAVTTPQLHFLVHRANYAGSVADPSTADASHSMHGPIQTSTASATAYTPSLDSYYSQFLGAFKQLAKGTEPLAGGPLYVDCANGVGGPHLAPLVQPLAELGLQLEVRNVPGSTSDSKEGEGNGVTGSRQGVLNHLVGADFVQKERVLPECFEDVAEAAR